VSWYFITVYLQSTIELSISSTIGGIQLRLRLTQQAYTIRIKQLKLKKN